MKRKKERMLGEAFWPLTNLTLGTDEGDADRGMSRFHDGGQG